MSGDTVLVVAPHALDEALGCGGVVRRHADAGDAVSVLILFGDGADHDKDRRIAAGKAAMALGSAPPSFAGFSENRSDTVPLAEIVRVVEQAVSELQPATVYVSHGGNLNIDHQTAFRATATALRPVPGLPVRRFLAYEILSSTDWAPPGFGALFVPTYYVDITPQLDRKVEALRLYGDEMRRQPHARSLGSVRALAARRGMSIGLPAAEAFAVLRWIET
ncbi:MAG: PIG-L deacetylase family protein [Alphaproteobacteria bacterium]